MAEPDEDRVNSGEDLKSQSQRAPGILQQPTEEQFRLTDAQKRLLEDLFEWGERSRKTHWILGRPLGS